MSELPALVIALISLAYVEEDGLLLFHVSNRFVNLRRWFDAYPDFGSEILPLEKQAAVLRRN
jgi:hypothetical protein